ncbi:unnamed protein product [Tuber melanosporum]|uniref:Beta-mannosidase B n=1 Tax=Tuber melanosporum (strain Mel28) TaxID=656061 RepID=D5G9R3_TUBMM|nr:uncharacterized protein GSTUM_00005036001 [Tuber melanosporum]CAZ81256.1 unnamed protein product [Tuber melanosporum]
MSKKTTLIHENWVFRQASPAPSELAQFRPVSQFPTNVHLDLLHHGLIPDPFFAKQEVNVQWVGEKGWVYKTSFATPGAHWVLGGERHVLVLEGLDTYAIVRVNGSEVLRSDNMFVTHRVDDGGGEEGEGENELEIEFDSAFLVGKKIVEEWPGHNWGCWNGDASRLAVRKAQYHYGWDWGPTLLTCGPWRPVYLESYNSRIAELYFTIHVPSSLHDVIITATAEVEGPCSEVVFALTSASGVKISPSTASVSRFKSGNGAITEARFEITDPELWFPHGYGAQPLYRLSATLGDRIDKLSKTLGIRRSQLIRRKFDDPEQKGETFLFEINNVSIFCGGSNWIPADNFIPRITDEKYQEWLGLLAAGNQVMVRVWAGGIYEEQIFYETCDKLGILVWQDFAFACGNYPAIIPEFRENVRKEAIDTVMKLRHHPSIVIWAGNNEDYAYIEGQPNQLGYKHEDKDPDNWLKTGFPARYIYEKILPEVVVGYGGGAPYHPGSPFTPGKGDSADKTAGDIHQWNGRTPYSPASQFDTLAGRFVSEFGMEAFPDIKTIDSYLPKDSKDRYPQSSTIDHHNKATGHERRIALYLVENIRYTFSPIEQYIYATQLMQAECLSTAYRLWRRQWQGPGKEYVAGALVWQINDCWPVTSWAIVDYHLRPKHAYFAVKRELEKFTIGMKRVQVNTPKDKYTNAYTNVDERVQVWIGSFVTEETKGASVVIRAFHLCGDKVAENTLKDDVALESNRSMEIADIRIPGWDGKPDSHRDIVLAAYLIDKDGSTLARRIGFFEPLKYLNLQIPKSLKVSVEDGCVRLSTDVPVKGVAVECTKKGIAFEDNCVDLVPDETVRIGVKGLAKGDDVTLRYLS